MEAKATHPSDENIIGEFRYGDAKERRKQGVSIETIRDWFPESTIQGKLPKSVLKAIWERYPEPAESVLKTSAIDVDMAGDLAEVCTFQRLGDEKHVQELLMCV